MQRLIESISGLMLWMGDTHLGTSLPSIWDPVIFIDDHFSMSKEGSAGMCFVSPRLVSIHISPFFGCLSFSVRRSKFLERISLSSEVILNRIDVMEGLS
jgi:hypothetical protein